MAASKLRQVLERDAGSKKFHWIIPHPFLPPRFRKLSQGRNMVLLFDEDFTLHVRWEGSRLNEHSPLSPRAAVRLLREAAQNMKGYKKELGIFSRFVDLCGEQPLGESKPTLATEQEAALTLEDELMEQLAVVEQGRGTTSLPTSAKGGESPMGNLEEFFSE